ncbi:hypothetical protein INT47_001703 [Mucor saturninus]|uniref:Uncharacterized protein n=1 Tax=Mucor saturninus TaxID=64648 RepID=A0A8H7RKQ8_9FUNG|nr:hypothetical protein INT47_001703 [Mucor saturninus]
MSDIVDRYASNLTVFKLSDFISHEKHFILKLEYDGVVNWKNLKQYWCSFIKDSNVIDWDDIASQIIRMHMEMDTRQAQYDLHARINKEVSDELASPFVQNVTIVEKGFIIRAKIDEYRRNANYINELHCQE